MKRMISVVLILSSFAILFIGCNKSKDTSAVTTLSPNTSTSQIQTTSIANSGTTKPKTTTATPQKKTTPCKNITSTYVPTKIRYIYAMPSASNVSRLEIFFTLRIDVSYVNANAKTYLQRGLKVLYNGVEIRKEQYRSNTPVININPEGRNDNRAVIYLNTQEQYSIKSADYKKLAVKVVANKIKDENGKFIPVTTRKADTNIPWVFNERTAESSPYYLPPNK